MQGLIAHGESNAFCSKDGETPDGQGESRRFLELRQFWVRSGVIINLFLRVVAANQFLVNKRS